MCNIGTRLNLYNVLASRVERLLVLIPCRAGRRAGQQPRRHPEPWMAAARSPRSAAEVAHHTGPFVDVSPGTLGWSVLCSASLPGGRGAADPASAGSGLSSTSLQAAS